MRMFAAAVIALTLGLTTAGCTSGNPAPDKTVPSNAAGPSLTFAEAYQQVPMNGTGAQPITWDLAGMPQTDEVLTAQRIVAYQQWLGRSQDWRPIVPLGHYFYTDALYTDVSAPFENAVSNTPQIGPLWIKYMGAEQTGPNRVMVIFCTDIGWWHNTKEADDVHRKNRADLDVSVMTKVRTSDGEEHWLSDKGLGKAGGEGNIPNRPKYEAQCTKWAQHTP